MLSESDVLAAPLSSWGEGIELHRAPPIREPGCSGAPRLALRVNELYPEILSPLLSLCFNLVFYHLLFLFSPSACFFVSFVLFITIIFLFSRPPVPPSLPLPIFSASENKLSLGLPTASVRGLQPHGDHWKFTCQTLLLYFSLVHN